MGNTSLYVEIELPLKSANSLEVVDGADGLIFDPAVAYDDPAIAIASPVTVLRTSHPELYEVWHEREGVSWVCDHGLEATARLQETFPDLSFVPRLDVYKPDVRYQFSPTFHGEGFKVYVPDTGAIKGYRVTEGNITLELEDAIARADHFGFQQLWLNSSNAQDENKGFDLDMLERARYQFKGGLWISGGAAKLQYLENLARCGGAQVAIVTELLLKEHGCEALCNALNTVQPSANVRDVV